MSEVIYLDYHATTPCDPRVLGAMAPAFTTVFANPASLQHAPGRMASSLVERAREEVASYLRCEPAEVVFTSGATESNNLAIKGCLRHAKARHMVTTAVEHKSVLDPCRAMEREGCEVSYAPPGPDGVVSAERILAALRPETVLVSVMLANNEVGTIQDVAAVSRVCRARGVLVHCDAVQAAPYLDLDVEALGVDLLSLSAHKLYGPKGVGALYVRRRRPRVRLEPLLDGGGHERGLRSGTLNVPGILGLASACGILLEDRAQDSLRARQLRDRLLLGLRRGLPDLVVNGCLDRRLPNNLNVSIPGLRATTLLERAAGVAAATGAACSSHGATGSYVLAAMGRPPDLQEASLRFGIGRFTTESEVDEATARIVEAAMRMREESTSTPASSCGESVADACSPGP